MKKIILVLILIPIISIAQDVKFKKYDHPNYSIEYPVNWILDESGTEGSLFFIYPSIKNNEKKFTENINLIRKSLGEQKLTINEIKAGIENQVASMMTNFKLLESKIKSKNGYFYHEMLVEGEANGMNFKSKLQTYIFDNFIYSLTLISKIEDYKAIKLISNKIMDSFSIK